MARISIIVTHRILNKDILKLSIDNLNSIKRNTHNDYELICIDNSSDLWSRVLTDAADIFVMNVDNLGNAKAWDQGMGVSSNDIVVFMDNDVIVEKDWDKEMVNLLSDDIGVTFPYSKVGDQEEYRARKDGFCFALNKDTYNKVGNFLEDQPFPNYYEDDWFFYRVAIFLNMRLVACKESKVWHKGQGTTNFIMDDKFKKEIEANKEWYEYKTNNRYVKVEKI